MNTHGKYGGRGALQGEMLEKSHITGPDGCMSVSRVEETKSGKKSDDTGKRDSTNFRERTE